MSHGSQRTRQRVRRVIRYERIVEAFDQQHARAVRRRDIQRLAVEKPREIVGVLVVEDQTAVRRLMKRMLKGAGYEVHDAGDGREALDLLERMDYAVDLLLTDVMMPRMDGPTLAAELRRSWPDESLKDSSVRAAKRRNCIGILCCPTFNSDWTNRTGRWATLKRPLK